MKGGRGGDRRSNATDDRDSDPGPYGPPAVVEVALDGGHRPGDGLDPRRPRGDHRGRDRRTPERRGQRPRVDRRAGRLRRFGVHPRRLCRRPLLRAPGRQDRPQEAVHAHAGRLHDRQRADGVLDQLPLVPRLPDHHQRGGGRRVLRHPLGGRSADPGSRPRRRGPNHRRVVLDRDDPRLACLARVARHGFLRPRRRLAGRVRHDRDHGPGHPARAPQRPGEPTLALPALPRRRGRASHPRDRASGRGVHGPGADRAAPHDPGQAARADGHRRDRERRIQDVPQAHVRRAVTVHRPGVSLQRYLLHLRAGADRDLRGQRFEHRPLPVAVRGRQLPGAAPAGALLRHRRPQAR